MSHYHHQICGVHATFGQSFPVLRSHVLRSKVCWEQVGGGSKVTLAISRTIYANGEFWTPITMPQKYCMEEVHFTTFTFLVILGTDGRGPSLRSHKDRHCSSNVCKVVVKFVLPGVRELPVAS